MRLDLTEGWSPNFIFSEFVSNFFFRTETLATISDQQEAGDDDAELKQNLAKMIYSVIFLGCLYFKNIQQG